MLSTSSPLHHNPRSHEEAKPGDREYGRQTMEAAAGGFAQRLSFNAKHPLVARSMAKPSQSFATTSRKGTTSVLFPMMGESPRPRTVAVRATKLLTNVEKLRLLTKAEKAGLLSAAEKLGLSLSTIEQLGLLSKAEELGVLSAATDPSTPSTLRTLSLALLALGPAFVFLVPEDYAWEIVAQGLVALVCVLGGSSAFAASTFVSNLQKPN